MSQRQQCTICVSGGKKIKYCKKAKCTCKIIYQNSGIHMCVTCIQSFFPFGSLDDKSLKECFQKKSFDQAKLAKCLNRAEYNNDENILDENIDPDINLLNDLKKKSMYFTCHEFNRRLSNTLSCTVSLLHLNCRSLRKNFQNVENMLNNIKIKFDVVAITESWLSSTDDLNLYKINGYEIEYMHRLNKRGGGILIYVKQNIKSTKLTNLSISQAGSMESLALELKLKHQKINLACIYRPPSTDISTFNNQLQNYVYSLSKTNKSKTIVCGDFNIDLLKCDSHGPTQDFNELMYSSGFFPVINKPTRITENSATLIDNIWINQINEHENLSGLIVDDISDHLPIYCIINPNCTSSSKSESTSKSVKYVRKEGQNNVSRLLEMLGKENWDCVMPQTNVNKAYNSFLEIYTNNYEKCCPLVKVREQNNPVNSKPWITSALKNAICKKNLLYKNFLKTPTSELKQKYKKYRNRLTSILRKSEKIYYEKLLNAYKNDTKKTWIVIKSVLKRNLVSPIHCKKFIHDGQSIEGGLNIAQSFNKYFTNVGPSLANQIKQLPHADHRLFMGEQVQQSMFLSMVTETEILKIVNNFKNKTSKDFNNVKMSSVKSLIPALIRPMTHICNLSLLTGIFPNNMKVAKIIPIFKSGKENELGNYRPISILPQFSKVLERVFYKRLMNFIEKNNILSNSQYGFRVNHSTNYALSELVELISDATENKKYALGLFIDLKKAFDTVDHTILIDKLSMYGVRGLPLDWVKSYLMQRQQYVSFNSTCSSKLEITCGVPQGSILGPLLFLLYVNDICNISTLVNLILFADDTSLFFSHHNAETLFQIVNMELEKLSKWFKINKMSLHIHKTKYILFGNKAPSPDIKIIIDNECLDKVLETNFLGVTVEHSLTWKKQITSIESKISKGIGILAKMKSKFNKKTLLLLYSTLILPYLNYCSEIWGNTYESHLKKICLLQKKAIRIISGLKPLDHCSESFADLGCLKFPDIVLLKSCIIVYKASNKSLPANILNRFHQVSSLHDHVTRHSTNFFQNAATKNTKQMCLSIKGISVFNALPKEIKMCKTVSSFKRNLKKYLLSKY